MTAATRPVLLEARDLGLARGGRQLFESLTLTCNSGDWIHLQGANGTGKTSLLRILAGLSRLGFEGEVSCMAELLYLGHHSAVKPLLTPRENLAMHLSGAIQRDAAAIDHALAAVDLYGYENRPCNSLSAGQQRRVNLARLYLSEAPLWLLDEPYTAIDVGGVQRLEARMAEHIADGGGIIMTSHQRVSQPGVSTVSLDEAASQHGAES
ncbi:cytochrome c biogenesis heme-transporting ATPase CcmA [Parahalioglobus pacificus]|uniref:Cytochrome c biogenesis ATP-binding export protein CcmA n=1 Tax=Parahalioglobus pacificus TaxID=930806 RepID=A0A919CJN6_9GAMM|nr:cytochrome c biogenesis heme-transporting ATPase CcmA [Halioglobus pacificus]GHD28933.1 cytochrome c biogenesis ATP-binding export protein CcmA [Halioglobus pacificus]